MDSVSCSFEILLVKVMIRLLSLQLISFYKLVFKTFVQFRLHSANHSALRLQFVTSTSKY